VDLNNEAFLSFVEGYRMVRNIDQGELKSFRCFFRWPHLLTFSRLLRALETGEQHDDPSWVRGLREKLGVKVNHHGKIRKLPGGGVKPAFSRRSFMECYAETR
jgi:Ser/Thr protein kinase RdoA (MazF antagonist)